MSEKSQIREQARKEFSQRIKELENENHDLVLQNTQLKDDLQREKTRLVHLELESVGFKNKIKRLEELCSLSDADLEAEKASIETNKKLASYLDAAVNFADMMGGKF